MKEKKNVRKKRQEHRIGDEVILAGISNRLPASQKETRSKFATRLDKLMEDRDINGVDFAKMVKVSTGAVSKYKRGQSEPTVSVLVQMAKHLNVSVDYLSGTSDLESPDESDISINNELGLSDGSIRGLRRYKEESDTLLKPLARLAALNFVFEQEEDLKAVYGSLEEQEAAISSWEQGHTRVLRDIADYLLVKTDASKEFHITYDGIKEEHELDGKLTASLEKKMSTISDELVDTLFLEKITSSLKQLKKSYTREIKG